MPKYSYTFVLLFAGTSFLSTGCIGRLFNRCCPPACGRPASRPLQRLHALHPPLRHEDDDGPPAVLPPHSRFHPVPTRPVFAAQYEPVPRSGLNGKFGPERIDPGRDPRPLDQAKPNPFEEDPAGPPAAEPAVPEADPPQEIPRSGSSGVTLNGPIRARPASSRAPQLKYVPTKARRPSRYMPDSPP